MFDELVTILIVFLVIIALMFGGAFWIRSSACSGRAVSFEAHDWGPVKGCMVLHNGKWLPLENIRGFDDNG